MRVLRCQRSSPVVVVFSHIASQHIEEPTELKNKSWSRLFARNVYCSSGHTKENGPLLRDLRDVSQGAFK